MVRHSVRALLSGLIDYAGLFPPAALDMKTAVKKYTAWRDGEFGWMLGRFVTPSARIAELRSAPGGKNVNVSALAGASLEADLEAVQGSHIDTVELKAGTPAQIRSAAEQIPKGITPYFEIHLAQDPRKSIEAIAEAGARAKVRTGGETVDAYPGSRDLARFLNCCADQNVAFKATAGLHHPLRGEHKLARGAGNPTVLMHGFLNVFLAAAFLRAGMEPTETVRLLEEQSRKAFQFEEDSVSWRDERLDVEQLEDARKHLGISFGSCSLDEPFAELQSLGLL